MDLLKDDSAGGEAFSSLDDQIFLLNFIMGTYLGPDIPLDKSRSSAFQRKAKDSTPYVSTDLGPSYLSVAMIENLYYYVIRNAHPSLALKPNIFHKYLKGNLHCPNLKRVEEYQQFTSFFPLDLHKQIWYPASFRVVKGVIFIDDPITSDLDEKDVEKFKALCYLGSFKIDKNEFINFEYDHEDVDSGEHYCLDNMLETNSGHGSNENHSPMFRSRQKLKRRCISDEPAAMSFLSIPNMDKCVWESDASIVISGTAQMGKSGPPVGLVDVGVGKVAYYFRVALPGVRKDYCKFSCEIGSDGKVHVRGLTTGGKTIKKPSRMFEMKFRQMCPSGPFTLTFCLPGPVDPRLFAPNFRSDGIFEGVIVKHG